MIAQIPAVGILKRNDYGDSMSYQIACECHQPDHDHNIWIEADVSDVSVTIYTTAKSKFWSFNRFQLIWTLLTKGYVEYEASIIMNKQQSLNYAEAVKSAIADVEKFRNTRQNKEERAIITKMANEQDCV